MLSTGGVRVSRIPTGERSGTPFTAYTETSGGGGTHVEDRHETSAGKRWCSLHDPGAPEVSVTRCRSSACNGIARRRGLWFFQRRR